MPKLQLLICLSPRCYCLVGWQENNIVMRKTCTLIPLSSHFFSSRTPFCHLSLMLTASITLLNALKRDVLYFFVEQLRAGIGPTITVPTDITIVLVAASNASGTTRQTIIATRETGLWARRAAALGLPVEALPRFLQELGIWSTPLPAALAQVDQQGLPLAEAEDLHPAGWVSTAPTAGALVALKRRSLGTSLAPGNPLRWPAWSTGIFTARTGAGAESARTATATAGPRTPLIREIPLHRDWPVRPVAPHAPTVGQALAAVRQAQIPSAVPAAARVAGKQSGFFLLFCCFF